MTALNDRESLLAPGCRFEDLDPLHWGRLQALALAGRPAPPAEAQAALPEADPLELLRRQGGDTAGGEDFLPWGLPWARLARFARLLLPPSCTYVLAVFEGEALWSACFVQFEGGRAAVVSGAPALDPEDLREVVGRDQHPFLLAAVAMRYRRPAFGWFCERADFEAWMLAPDVASKEEAFQRAIMAGRATFDFNALIARGITPLSPINPGTAAFDGEERGDNPRTREPGSGAA